MTVGHRPRVGRAFRRIALLGATALLFALLPGGVAFAEHFENTDVLDADNAVEAAVNWSQFTFDSATDVALGRNDKFPDNLASSVIQGTDTPLLYTDGDSLSEETADELARLGAETIHVLGGEEAISEDVVDELESLGYEIHRDAGITRIETALDIAARHAADATHGLVVRAFGDDAGDETRAWADALAAGGWAAEEGWPVFLTQSDELNDNVRAYLEDSAIESLTIIGGTSAISAAVQSELEAMGIDVDRVSGSNRFATAVAIAEARGFADAGDAGEVILSEGQQSDAWAGGFAAAAYSAISGAPIVLSNGANIPPETQEFLEGAGADGTVALVCGPFVEPEACDEAAQILGHEHAPHTNQTYTATPADAAVNTVSVNDGTNNNRGSRQYTINTGSANQVDIQLFPAANVRVADDGTVTFVDTNSDNIADPGAPAGFIAVVNGAGTSGTRVDDVTPVNGQVTFTINSTGAGSVIPVVFTDNRPTATGDDSLNLTAPTTANASPKTPAEAFGIGGQKTWVPDEASGGTINQTNANGVDVTSVNKAADFFTGCEITTDNTAPAADVTNANCATYYYDANDTFQINGVPVTMASFEQNLSTGDDVTGTYAPDPAATSSFNLEDEAPNTPTGVTAAAVDGSSTSVKVDWTGVAGADSYNVYRISDPDNLENATCPAPNSSFTGWTKVATVTAPTVTYTDSGLAPNTTYCYFVTTVKDGDESNASNRDDAKTPAADATVRPLITDARVTTDAGLQDRADTGDVWTIVFNKSMDTASVTSAGRFILRDADGDTVDVTCSSNGNVCAFNTNDQTVGGSTYPAARVLTITLGTNAAWTDAAPTGDGWSYPLTIQTVNAAVRDAQGNVVNLPDSPDKVVDKE